MSGLPTGKWHGATGRGVEDKPPLDPSGYYRGQLVLDGGGGRGVRSLRRSRSRLSVVYPDCVGDQLVEVCRIRQGPQLISDNVTERTQKRPLQRLLFA